MAVELASVTYRTIEEGDNAAIALIIRNTLEEFGAAHPGTVYFDKSTDQLFELFRTPNSKYFIAEAEGKVLGGAGVFPTEGLPKHTAELVKMYLVPEARGIGIGKQLILMCMDCARHLGFQQLYLETMPELSRAVALYHRLGFRDLNAPMGQSGHFGCGIWMLKAL